MPLYISVMVISAGMPRTIRELHVFNIRVLRDQHDKLRLIDQEKIVIGSVLGGLI
jgi:hypothetical protein